MNADMPEPTGTPSEASASHNGDTGRAQGTGELDVTVRELSRDECLAILAKHHVGRVGIAFHDHLRVKICNYLYSEHWIYVRAELGEDLTMAQHHPWAAFEVDEVDGVVDWRSVDVRGAIEFLSADMHSQDWFAFENAVHLLRDAVPEILRAGDPYPNRTRLLRIHLDNVVGRESRAGKSKPLLLP